MSEPKFNPIRRGRGGPQADAFLGRWRARETGEGGEAKGERLHSISEKLRKMLAAMEAEGAKS